MNDDVRQRLRDLPSVSELLEDLTDLATVWGHTLVTSTIQVELDDARSRLRSIDSATMTKPMENRQSHRDAVIEAVKLRLAMLATPSLRPVFNLTGIVLHSNLGRASLSESALEAVSKAAATSTNLEYDLETGARGDRDSHVEGLICELSGAEAATVVNNNAAAVLLTLNTLALGKSVPVSRGELVEIGGSFRVPDIMARSGCTLTEVGTTNRTHLKDYEHAINDNTALLMRVHTSNYRIEGFTHTVPEHALATLARLHQIPFVIDMGCGNLVDLTALGLPHEATAQQSLKNGADLVLFSGDKLLGGPQAGIIAGRKELIERIKHNPIKRALRIDKMTLAALEATLRLYRHPESLTEQLPTLRLLTRQQSDIRAQACRLAPQLMQSLNGDYRVEVIELSSQIGSGSLPVEVLPSAGWRIDAIDGSDEALRRLLVCLRELPKPIIGRLNNGALLLDCRCLEADSEAAFLAQISELPL